MSVSCTDNKPGGGREEWREPTGPGSSSSPQNELTICYFSGGEGVSDIMEMQLSELSTASPQQRMFKLGHAVQHGFASNLNDTRCTRLVMDVSVHYWPLISLKCLGCDGCFKSLICTPIAFASHWAEMLDFPLDQTFPFRFMSRNLLWDTLAVQRLIPRC